MHRIYDSKHSKRAIDIEALRLDDYFSDYDGKIDFIKMDIEGAELSAVQGMSSLLRKNRQVTIVTEFIPANIRGFGAEPEHYISLLTDSGFSSTSSGLSWAAVTPARASIATMAIDFAEIMRPPSVPSKVRSVPTPGPGG